MADSNCLTSGPAHKRCWSCRARKVACDKTRPFCNNCLRSGRHCEGYGLRLSWPGESGSGRSIRSGHYTIPVNSTDLPFVTASSYDIERFYTLRRTVHHQAMSQACIPRTLEFVSMNSETLDPFMANTRCSAISRLVSCDIGPLYGLLVRMSLSDETPPSLATRHAMAALSFQQLGRTTTALLHQTRAMRALQIAIDNPPERTRHIQTMAASMLLHLFETLNSSSPTMQWAVFFCGAKNIGCAVRYPQNARDSDYLLVMAWTFYHDIMYKFSIQHWEPIMEPQNQTLAQTKLMSKAVSAPSIQGLLSCIGCSVEMLHLIGEMVDVVIERLSPNFLSESHLREIMLLEMRLRNLEQQVPAFLGLTPEQTHHIQTLGELFRLSGLIYLYRIVKGALRDSEPLRSLLTDAYRMLRELDVCEPPWPLFVVGIEARTDEERKLILAITTASSKLRPLSNILLVSRMIEAAWVLQDLHDGAVYDPLTIYNEVITRNRVPPPFT